MNAKQHAVLMKRLENDPEYRRWFRVGRDAFHPERDIAFAYDDQVAARLQSPKVWGGFATGWGIAASQGKKAQQ